MDGSSRAFSAARVARSLLLLPNPPAKPGEGLLLHCPLRLGTVRAVTNSLMDHHLYGNSVVLQRSVELVGIGDGYTQIVFPVLDKGGRTRRLDIGQRRYFSIDLRILPRSCPQHM